MHTYHRIERERRFLLKEFPASAQVTRVHRITDRYLLGTSLRLRQQLDDAGPPVFKLTQKLPSPGAGAQQGFITNIYLTADEFHVVAQLPANEVRKTRFSVPPFGIDVFEESLTGLILAEAEFDSAQEAEALVIPAFVVQEVTTNTRFTGGRLAATSQEELRNWLSEFRIGSPGILKT